MFSDPFQKQSVAALQETSPKVAPKRPKSPPKSSEEWILSQEQDQAWPKRAPEGERLLEDAERKDEANLIFGSLQSIKDDIQRHARTSHGPL